MSLFLTEAIRSGHHRQVWFFRHAVSSPSNSAPVTCSEVPSLFIAVGDRCAVVADHACQHHLRAKCRDANHCRSETGIADQVGPHTPAVLPADISGMAMIVSCAARHVAALRLARLDRVRGQGAKLELRRHIMFG